MPYRQGQMVAGDYYGMRAQGDLFGFLKKAVGGIAKVAGSILPGPFGAVGTAVSRVLLPSNPVIRQNPIGATLPPPPMLGKPLPNFYGVQAGSTRFGLTTAPSSPLAEHALASLPSGRKRRRMNVANVKALRRAGRRVKGFEKLARRFIGFASPHRPKGRTYFKRKAR